MLRKTSLNTSLLMSVFLVAMVCSIASGGTIYGVAAAPPTHATNPDPPDGAVDVAIETNLTWMRGDGAKWDQVYFGTDPCDANLTLVATIPDYLPAEYDPRDPDPGTEPNLLPSTTYYWYITEVNGPNEYPGPVWSFSTIPGEAQCDYPEDGAMIAGDPCPLDPAYIYTELIFIPGPTAFKHTVYCSKVRDEVANRVEDAKFPWPEVTVPEYEPRYYPGCPGYPPYESLIRGQVYYWTVDANDAFGNTFSGDVWEFTIQPYEAFVPSPVDGANNVDSNVLLSWLSGYGAQGHDVFLGTNWEDVNNARFSFHGSSPEYQGTTNPGVLSWQCSGLAHDTKYYWKIDEYQGRIPPSAGTIYKGDVWCFTTVGGEAQCDYPEDGAVIPGDPYPLDPDIIYTEMTFIIGATAVKHTGYLSTNRDDVANRVEDANLGPPPLAGLGYPEKYERLYYAGRPEYYPYESLIRGTKYYWTVDETNAEGNVFSGEIWEFTVQDYKASLPNPPNEATFVETDVLLSWVPGIDVKWHHIYFGTSFDDVNNPPWDPVILPPAEFLGTTLEPYIFVTGLAFNTKYYWRVDEVSHGIPPSPGTIYKGDVWCFTTVPHRIFVDVDAAGANDGTNWADAYNYLKDALIEADSALKQVEIRVAEGIYKPDRSTADPNGSGSRGASFGLINGVTVKGGYAGFGEPDPDARDIEAYETVLSGDLAGNDADVNEARELLDDPCRAENSYHVVYSYEDDANAVLDGFTITSGNANGTYGANVGGGVYCELSSPIIVNCRFSRNTASHGGGMFNYGFDPYGSGGQPPPEYLGKPVLTNCTFIMNSAEYSGGGMFNCCLAEPTVTNCVFIDNWADMYGGGMYNSDSNSIITNCTFSGNSSSWYGGGMSNRLRNPIVTGCTFRKNWAPYGGGMYNWEDSSPIVTNCLFVENDAPDGGGMFSQDSNPRLRNCTFSWNWHYGILNWGGGTVTLTNCILWGDWFGEEIAGGPVVVTYSNVQRGWPGEGNIDTDPCFVELGHWEDPCNTPSYYLDDIWVEGDYHLLPDSPCIDAGDNNAPNLPDTDMDGHPRIIDGDCNDTEIVDMGAYEFNYAYMGDFDYDCSVDFVDFSIFGLAWMTKPGDAQWNRFCDISKPSDNYIDWRDAAIVCDNWLAEIP